MKTSFFLFSLLADTPKGSVFALDQQTLISAGILLLNACILAAALSFLLYKPVRNFLKKRSTYIEAQFSNAQDNMDKANELRSLYEQKLDEIDQERIKVLESANELASERSKQLLLNAEHTAAAERARAEAELQTERERVNEELRQHIIDVACVVAEKFVAHAIDPSVQDRLFDEAMAELEETAWPS